MFVCVSVYFVYLMAKELTMKYKKHKTKKNISGELLQ